MYKIKIDKHVLFPFMFWIGKLKSFKVIKKDIIAWLTVGFIIIPQSMAYASLAGLPIQVWLYTWLVATFIAWLFGATRQMSTWPSTIISLMTATALFSIVWDNVAAYSVYASLLAIFTGLFYILLGNLKLWIIVDFLSRPLIIWFTSAVAIITITSQAGKLFWVSYDKGSNYFEWLLNLIISIMQNLHIPTLIFWIISVLFLVILKKYLPKVPRVLFLIIIATIISYYIWYNSNMWGKIIQSIPNSLPAFDLPFLSEYIYNNLNFNQLINVIMYSLIIGIIWFTQTISVSKYINTKNHEKVNANRELIGQWITNIFTGMFSWYWVAWSLSKTAVNVRAWAKTWFASIVTGIFILITILYLTQYLYYMPMVILAAIILVAVVELIKIKPLIKAFKIEKHDWIVGIFTFFITLLFARDLHVGIFFGILLSLWLFISRTMRPRLVEVAMYKDWNYKDIKLFGLKTSKKISVFRFDWVLYFANANYFEDKIIDYVSEKEKLKFVIIDLEWMPDIDTSGLQILETLTNSLKESWIKVYLTSIRVNVIKKMSDFWFIDRFKNKRIFAKIQDVINYIDDKYNDDIKTKSLEEYTPEKNNKKSEGVKIIKKSL